MAETPRTPENAPKIPRDESFKTCKASPVVRRQLRATPARLSMLSGNKPFKEANSSHKKFNSRRKGRHDDTAGSNETFVRHEQNLLYDRDSLDPTQQLSHNFLDNVTEQVTTPRTSSPMIQLDADNNNQKQQRDANSPSKRASPRKSSSKRSSASATSPKKTSPRKSLASKLSPIKSSPNKQQATRVFTKPLPKPRPLMAAPRATPKPPPPMQWNRYMSSTAKKPTGPPTSQFKRPVMNSSVASSRRCLGQWNTPRVTRTQSFKSTAELERDYFTSLRSSRS